MKFPKIKLCRSWQFVFFIYLNQFIKKYNVIVNRKNFYNQPIDFDIKWYKEIRKSTVEKGEDYTTECFLDYKYVENHYRLEAVHLSRQKQLDADPKAIQLVEFYGQSKKLNDAGNDTDKGAD